jgi:hypothetical protein
MQMILNRLKEPSTYAGIAGLLAGMHLMGWTADQWTAVLGVVSAIAGAVAAVLPERK